MPTYTYDPLLYDAVVYGIRLNTFGDDTSDPIFSDEELLYLYTQQQNSVKRASAQVLRIVAVREAFVQKVIKLLQLSTNGAATAQALRTLAQDLEAQAETEENEASNSSGFAIANPILTTFNFDEIIKARRWS